VLAGVGWTPEPAAASGATRERWESLAGIVRIAEEVAAADPSAGLRGLVAELAERASAQHAPTVDGVTLATLHAAKGLEWDAVFLVGVSEGLLPIAMADSEEAIEEERRLLYVGVTRAREHLAVSWARARTPGGRGTRSPSRFLDGVRPRGIAAADDARPAGRDRKATKGPARCSVCGRALLTAAERKLRRCAGCPSTMDDELFERLRTWRLETSREQNAPAFVVFTDATLTAIAEARPQQPADLLEIPGIGRSKLDKYGEAVLAICADDAGTSAGQDTAG
jgi:DNA helicase II / ATP-dependent DNA helicase PcrA